MEYTDYVILCMGFSIEVINCIDQYPWFNIQMESELCKNIYVKFHTTQAEVHEQLSL